MVKNCFLQVGFFMHNRCILLIERSSQYIPNHFIVMHLCNWIHVVTLVQSNFDSTTHSLRVVICLAIQIPNRLWTAGTRPSFRCGVTTDMYVVINVLQISFNVKAFC